MPEPDRVRQASIGDASAPPRRSTLAEVALLFLKLGTIAFGGPAAHIAMMEDEVVHRRRWMSRDAFLDYVGATNLIPGPNSTELAIHIGHRQAGWPGLLVAGLCFIVPATLAVLAIAWGYERFGTLPEAAALMYGIRPVVIAIVLQAIWRLGRSAVKSRWLAVVGIIAAALVAAGAHEIAVLFAAGGALALLAWLGRRPGRGGASSLLLAAGGAAPAMPATLATVGLTAAAQAATPVGLWPLFAIFLKIGSILFGSGYVLLAFLRADLVERLGWLSESQLLDAISVGQITPGPVFTTATFIGYLIAGGGGAMVATAGIFLPAFVFVAVSGPLVPRIRRSAIAGAALDGVNVASLALMTVVTLQLGRVALIDPVTVLIAAVSAVLLLRWRLNAAWLVLAGAAAGLVIGATTTLPG